MLAISSPENLPGNDTKLMSTYMNQAHSSPFVPLGQSMSNTNYAIADQENSHRGSMSSNSHLVSHGSQFMKPNLRLSNSSSYGVTRKQKKPIESVTNEREQLRDLPIYKLLKVFKLNQYAHKMNDMGYGQDVYKLALLNNK